MKYDNGKRIATSNAIATYDIITRFFSHQLLASSSYPIMNEIQERPWSKDGTFETDLLDSLKYQVKYCRVFCGLKCISLALFIKKIVSLQVYLLTIWPWMQVYKPFIGQVDK